MSGTLPLSRGSAHESSPPSASLADRASASAKNGFFVSGIESLLPLTNRLTISTPAEM